MKIRIAFFSILLGMAVQGLLTPSASAGFLKINLSVQARTYHDRVDFLVLTKNLGTAVAHQVELELRSDDILMKAEPEKRLLPHQTFQRLFSIPLAGKKAGEYPYVVRCHYMDLNDQPVSAVLVSTYIDGKGDSLPLRLTLNDVGIRRFGDIYCSIENLSDENLILTQWFVLPDGFLMKPLQRRVVLHALEKKRLYYKLTNNTTVADAIYPFYSIVEADKIIRRSTLVKESRIHVSPSLNENRFFRSRWRWVFGYFLVLAIVILFRFTRRRTR